MVTDGTPRPRRQIAQRGARVTLEFPNVNASAPLVDIADAKAVLKVTDTAHDALITATLGRATDSILSYLKAGADPAWTVSTVPLPVQAAILHLLTHQYEHPGDDMTNDEKVWGAIDKLLARFRDPTLA